MKQILHKIVRKLKKHPVRTGSAGRKALLDREEEEDLFKLTVSLILYNKIQLIQGKKHSLQPCRGEKPFRMYNNPIFKTNRLQQQKTSLF